MTTQPLLNMGAPVKMRGSVPASPNKQVGLAKTLVKAIPVKNIVKDALALVKNGLPKAKVYAAEVVKNSKSGSKALQQKALKTYTTKSVGTGLDAGKGKFYQNFKKTAKYGVAGWGLASLMGGSEPTRAEVSPKPTPTPTPPKTKKPYVKKGGKATGNMKDYKIGSQERADEYTARGWKQDHTTKVTKKKEAKAIKQEPTKPAEIQIESRLDKPVIKAEAKAKSPKARRLANKGAKKTGKAAKKQAQADKASAAGNTRKAARKQKAADRKSRKADKKFRQADGAINPDQY
jgi:hypothetical protein